jgi:single-strand DNA-binding protein
MADLNMIALAGNLTRTPELRHTAKGQAVCSARIANNGFRKDKEALFIDITVWGRDAEYMAANCEKGTQVQITGRLESETYTGRDGKERTTFSVNVRDLHVKKAMKDDTAGAGYGGSKTNWSGTSETAEAFNESFDSPVDPVPF